MWISSKVFDKIVESNTDLQRKIELLEDSRDSMKKRIDTLAKATAGIEYGDTYMTYLGFGSHMPTKKRKSLNEVVNCILKHLKLEITDIAAVPEIPATTNLTKIKPIKPKK